MYEKHRASTWVLLTDIRISERRRRRIQSKTVERYRALLEAGFEAPPVVLVRDGTGYAVRDGRHRVAAAIAAGNTGIEAVVASRRQWLTMVLAWIRAFGAASQPAPLGDEALTAEHLACTEEERVRLPPSPLHGAAA